MQRGKNDPLRSTVLGVLNVILFSVKAIKRRFNDFYVCYCRLKYLIFIHHNGSKKT